jgi:cysteine sulfinate desulfinase/cysteine desulfurase-like protein
MGYADAKAASGVRFSLGPWHSIQDLAGVAAALQRARQHDGMNHQPGPPKVS